MRKVVAVGDLHAPWTCQDTLDLIYRTVEEEKPKVVIQVGDAFDMFSQAKFPRSHTLCTPKEEFEEARRLLEAFWKNIKKRVPSAECHLLLGNHDVRPHKRLIEKAPELEMFFDLDRAFKFPGVSTMLDPRDDLEIDGVVYEHGYMTRVGAHLRENMKPTVFGHLHRPHIHYEQIRGKLLWEFNLGYAGRPEALPLSYTPKKHVKWVRGVGVIDDQGPRFIPTRIKEKARR